jgi:hypothetical protein
LDRNRRAAQERAGLGGDGDGSGRPRESDYYPAPAGSRGPAFIGRAEAGAKPLGFILSSYGRSPRTSRARSPDGAEPLHLRPLTTQEP